MSRAKKKKISKSYRTYLFKMRLINIVHLLLDDADTRCYFCYKHFMASDFPLQGKDKVEIHHTSYIPEEKVLAHKKCHRKYHADKNKRKRNL
jgi:hypothetical protein